MRLCSEHKHHRECVHIYSLMKLYEEAVDLALSVSDENIFLKVMKVIQYILWYHCVWLESAFHVFGTNTHVRIYDHHELSTLFWNLHAYLTHQSSSLINHCVVTWPLISMSFLSDEIYLKGCQSSQWKSCEKHWLLHNCVFELHICTNLRPCKYIHKIIMWLHKTYTHEFMWFHSISIAWRIYIGIIIKKNYPYYKVPLCYPIARVKYAFNINMLSSNIDMGMLSQSLYGNHTRCQARRWLFSTENHWGMKTIVLWNHWLVYSFTAFSLPLFIGNRITALKEVWCEDL